MRFTSLLLLPSLLLLGACGDDSKPPAPEEPDAAASDEPEELSEEQKKMAEGLGKAVEGMGGQNLSGMPVALQSKLVSVDAEDAADLAVRAKHVGDTFHVDIQGAPLCSAEGTSLEAVRYESRVTLQVTPSEPCPEGKTGTMKLEITSHPGRFTGSVIEVTFAGDPPTRIPQANIAKDS